MPAGGVIRTVHQQRREEEYERKLRIERHRRQAGDERERAATDEQCGRRREANAMGCPMQRDHAGEKGQNEFKCLDCMHRLTTDLWLGGVMKPPSPIGSSTG
jgi:hypothetical protein